MCSLNTQKKLCEIFFYATNMVGHEYPGEGAVKTAGSTAAGSTILTWTKNCYMC